jgi:Protein of unknown function (DUF3352)
VRIRDLFEDLRHALTRTLGRVGRLLRGALGLIAIPLLAAGRFIRRIGHAVSDFWFRRSLSFRRRTAAVALVLIAYAVVRWVAVPGVPCSISAAKECPPSDDAIALVPDDAYAYVHVNLDGSSSQFRAARGLADVLPHFDAVEQGTLQLAGLGNLNAGADIAPWIGDEAAYADVPSARGRPRPLFLLSVADQAAAKRFAAKLGRGGQRSSKQDGVEIDSYPSGLTTAQLGEFLVLGQRSTVDAAVAVSTGKAHSLQGSATADAVRGKLPDNRFADAYVSASGISRLLAGRPGLPSQLDTFTDYSASRGIAAAVVAHDDGFELQIDSLLDPGRAKADPPFFAAFNGFTPSLAGELAPDTLAYLGIADPSATVTRLLQEADAAVPGVSAAFNRFDAGLRREGKVDLAHDVLPLLRGEAALAIAPGRPVPYLTLIFNGVDEKKARDAVARLQAPIISALNPAQTGQVPIFKTRQVEDITTYNVSLSPSLNLSYAVWDGKLAISTNPAGVREAIGGDTHLAGQQSYQSAASAASGSVSALVFLNLEGLVKLAEPNGLSSIAPYAAFKMDIAKLRSLGLSVTSGEDTLQTEIFLNVE